MSFSLQKRVGAIITICKCKNYNSVDEMISDTKELLSTEIIDFNASNLTSVFRNNFKKHSTSRCLLQTMHIIKISKSANFCISQNRFKMFALPLKFVLFHILYTGISSVFLTEPSTAKQK